MPDEIFAMLCAIPIISLPFVFFGFLRYMRYKETMALAEKGLLPQDYTGNGRGTLRWGIILTAVGLALSCGLYPIGWMTGDQFLFNFGPWMLIGLIPAALGIAFLLIAWLTKKENGNGSTAAYAPLGSTPPSTGAGYDWGAGAGSGADGADTVVDAGVAPKSDEGDTPAY